MPMHRFSIAGSFAMLGTPYMMFCGGSVGARISARKAQGRGRYIRDNERFLDSVCRQQLFLFPEPELWTTDQRKAAKFGFGWEGRSGHLRWRSMKTPMSPESLFYGCPRIDHHISSILSWMASESPADHRHISPKSLGTTSNI